jgi:VCBS repeat protein
VSGNLTVQVPSGFAQFSDGTLTGGAYAAGYSGNTVANSNTLYLDVGGVVTTDSATITLDRGGAIESFDSASSSYASIQSTPNLISAAGTLSLADPYDWETPLTVAGALSLSGGNASLSAPELIVDPGGTVSGAGTINAPIANSGVIFAGLRSEPNSETGPGGELDIQGAVTGDGTIEIIPDQGDYLGEATSTLELGGPDSNNVSFADGTGTLKLDDPSAFSGTITEGGPGDQIILAGVSYASVTGYSYVGSAAGGTLTINAGGTAYTLNFVGDFDTSSFALSAGPQLFTSSPPSLLIKHGGPLILSGMASQFTTDMSTVTPFSFPPPSNLRDVPGTAVTIEDVGNPTETLTVTRSSAANGVLSNLGGGAYDALTGVYTVSGSLAAVTTALDGLVFTPRISDAPLESTTTTTFTIVVNDGIVPPVTDSTTSVVTTQALTPLAGGEGSSDILWENPSTGQVSTWEMNGNSQIGGEPVTPNPGPSWQAIGTGNFSDDGHSEILMQNADGQVSVWEMNGNTVIGGGPVANPGPNWRAVGTGDFNNDGDSDILMQNTSTGQISIWEMSGNSIIGGGPARADPGPAWQAIGTGDFNENGDADILLQNANTGQASIWEMNGNTIAGGGPVSPNPGPSWHAIGLI